MIPPVSNIVNMTHAEWNCASVSHDEARNVTHTTICCEEPQQGYVANKLELAPVILRQPFSHI